MRESRSLTPSLRYLGSRLALVEARVRAAVESRRASDADPDDRFRGLYISDAQVDELLSAAGREPQPDHTLDSADLAAVEAAADEDERTGADIRLRRLARSFELDRVDVDVLLTALAPDLDPRFERLYAYLHDDVSRRRASTGLALELAAGTGSFLAIGIDRARLHPSRPLQAGGLLVVDEMERPFLTRSLRVPDRVTLHLLGDDTVEPLLAALAAARAPFSASSGRARDDVIRGLNAGIRLTYIRQRTGAAGATLASTAATEAGLKPLCLDVERLEPGDDHAAVARAAIREARLTGSALVIGPLEALAERSPHAVRAFAEAACPVLIFGSRAWEPTWTRSVPVVVEAPVPTPSQRRELWQLAVDGTAAAAGGEPMQAAAHFRLTPEQVWRAAEAASQQAVAAGRPLEHADLQAGARAQNASGLERLARRIEPHARWSDLVLPADVVAQLGELTARVRQRDRVIDEWRMGTASSKGRGITALFAGDSGTGKTLSAEVVAGDVGLDLYVIDLSTVVDKYIGETEKNLDRIFTEADRVNGVLLFDEADAIFGKRSEVKDARDRYANVEVAYLLQRMELFDGLAILTTNLRANVDEAFLRRLDSIVDFALPEEEDRRRIWERHLNRGAPLADDIDAGFLAAAFRLSGGNIRNIVLAASYLAAEEGGPITMAHLIRGTQREYGKLGRLLVEAEFGPHFELVVPGVANATR